MTRLRILNSSSLLLSGIMVISLIAQTVQAQNRTGDSLDMTAVNFPSSGSGQIDIDAGPQSLGSTGLTVEHSSITLLPSGDELLETWFSVDRDDETPLADEPGPGSISFALEPLGSLRLETAQLMITFLIDGEPQTPGNPFMLPPLMNIGPHPFSQELGGRDFDVIIAAGGPPGGFQYDEQDRLLITAPAGLFPGQTFYNGGQMGPPVGSLEMFGYTEDQRRQINGIYNARLIQEVPEPSSFILAIGGCFMVFSSCRSRRTARPLR